MPRPEKVQAVADIRERLENARAIFLTEYRGLSVQAVQDLRRSLRNAGAEYKVVKMSLAKLAAKDAGIEGLDEYLGGPTALAFAGEDTVAAAKALKDFAKDYEVLVLKAGYLAGDLLTPEEISKLAEIEPREVLLAKIAGAARAPMFKAAGMFGSFTRDAASVFSQLLDEKESGELAPAEAVEEATLPAEEPEETKAAEAEEE